MSWTSARDQTIMCFSGMTDTMSEAPFTQLQLVMNVKTFGWYQYKHLFFLIANITDVKWNEN